MAAVLENIREASTIYCEANKHLFTDEEIQFFERAAQGKIHSSKFWRRKTEMAVQQTRKAYAENPEQGLRIVVVNILNTLPEHTPAEQLQLFTNTITQEWQLLQAAPVEG